MANDSLCALDDKDETYKCVASKKDLDIQKHGKKKKKNPVVVVADRNRQ